MNPDLLKDLIVFTRKTIQFPYGQVCKHLVAADMLCLLEKHGVPISSEVAKAVVGCEDEEAIRLLGELEEKSCKK